MRVPDLKLKDLEFYEVTSERTSEINICLIILKDKSVCCS